MPQLPTGGDGTKRIDRSTVCLIPGCTREPAYAFKTGLCMKCHSSAKKLVESGKTTWERLTALGLARMEVEDPFTKAFKERNK